MDVHDKWGEKMSRLIDADALIDDLELMYEHRDDKDEPYNIGVRGAINMTRKASTIDIPHSDDWERYSERLWKKAYERGKADRPQGEWIDRGMRVPSSWVKKCSLCGHETDTWRWCNFCPNCGAQMKGADDE